MATSDMPGRLEMADTADLILIGKVIDIQVRTSDTLIVFQVSEYIKETYSSPEFTLTTLGGMNSTVSPAPPTFIQGREYLLYLMEKEFINLMNDDKFYDILLGSWGKDFLENVDEEFLEFLREEYGSTPVPLVEVEPISRERAQELALEAFYDLLIDAYDIDVRKTARVDYEHPIGSGIFIDAWRVSIHGKGIDRRTGTLVVQTTGFGVVVETGEVIPGVTVGSELSYLHVEFLKAYPETIMYILAAALITALYVFVRYSRKEIVN